MVFAPELRQVSDTDLRSILDDHRLWVESEGKQGRPADLSRAFLRGQSFRGAVLQRANFSDADLVGTDFTSADLCGGRFGTANVHSALFYDTILADADLSETTNLVAAQLHAI